MNHRLKVTILRQLSSMALNSLIFLPPRSEVSFPWVETLYSFSNTLTEIMLCPFPSSGLSKVVVSFFSVLKCSVQYSGRNQSPRRFPVVVLANDPNYPTNCQHQLLDLLTVKVFKRLQPQVSSSHPLSHPCWYWAWQASCAWRTLTIFLICKQKKWLLLP